MQEHDSRKIEAWTLCDNWNGQLSTSVFGPDASENMTERQMKEKMLQRFNHFDRDNSGTIDWEELHLALKDMAICCTDDGSLSLIVVIYAVTCLMVALARGARVRLLSDTRNSTDGRGSGDVYIARYVETSEQLSFFGKDGSITMLLCAQSSVFLDEMIFHLYSIRKESCFYLVRST